MFRYRTYQSRFPLLSNSVQVPTGPGDSGWTPLDLNTNTLAWWDSSQGVSTSSSSVTSWIDRKSGYNAVQGTSASQPTFSVTSFNGAPGITSDGTDDFLEIETSPFPIDANPIEIWAVSQNTDIISTTTRILVSYGAAAATARRLGRQTGNTMFIATGTGGGAPFAATTDTVPSRHVLNARIGATTSFVSIDGGTENSVSAVPATTNTRFRIFANSGSASANQFWQGVTRHIVITSPLTSGQRTLMLAWAMSQRN